MTPAEIRTFIRAGRAVFTLQSAKTGTHFTYRVSEGQHARGIGQGPLFASVLIAPEVWAYLGTLVDLKLVPTRGSKVAPEAPSFKALSFLLKQLDRIALPPALVFRHEGRCGRCGRALTTPASIDTGLGPDCAEALGVPHEARPSTVDADIAAYRASKLAALLPTRRPSYSLDTDGKGNFGSDDDWGDEP